MSDYIKREDAAERVAFEIMYEAAIAKGLTYKELIELEAKKQEKIKLYVQKWLEQVPSADVVEVRHGRWIGKTYKCSLCGKWVDPLQGDADMNYCPNCGAKMDGEEQEHEHID